jgi:hypothetical protein
MTKKSNEGASKTEGISSKAEILGHTWQFSRGFGDMMRKYLLCEHTRENRTSPLSHLGEGVMSGGQ